MRIQSAELDVLVLPEVGGKIAHIRDRVSGREWLVPPQRPHQTLDQREHKWVDYDTSGMDDCFPNVDECVYPLPPWKGLQLPQLGEWVYGKWNVVAHSPVRIVLERNGTHVPWRAQKTVRLHANTLEVQYRVENLGSAPIQYIWSAHPLIAVGPQFQIRVPGEATFTTYPPDGNLYQWPWYGDIDLSRQWIAAGRTLKVFVRGLKFGSCELESENGTVVTHFDNSVIPVLGLWFNNFGFPRGERSPFRCIAVEPCTSPSDVLDEPDSEVDHVLGPNEVVEWSVRMQFVPRLR